MRRDVAELVVDTLYVRERVAIPRTTRADVVANLGVIVSGVLVAATGVRYPDLLVGAAIGIYVIKEAVEILREAREAETRAAVKP